MSAFWQKLFLMAANKLKVNMIRLEDFKHDGHVCTGIRVDDFVVIYCKQN